MCLDLRVIVESVERVIHVRDQMGIKDISSREQTVISQ